MKKNIKATVPFRLGVGRGGGGGGLKVRFPCISIVVLTVVITVVQGVCGLPHTCYGRGISEIYFLFSSFFCVCT